MIFISLYIYATSLYPGGSQADINSIGFDWVNNYWCNLLNERGINGEDNAARPIAISAMIILCASLVVFFFQFANRLVTSHRWKIIIKIFGTLSMISAGLIFTKYHDIMTTISSVFGIVVVIGIIRTIYKTNMTAFKIGGMCCILFLGVNNVIYYSGKYIEYLPVIQKITFILVLGWIVGLSRKMRGIKEPEKG